MSTQRVISVKQFTAPDSMAHTCTAPQPSVHKLFNAKSDHCGSTSDAPSACSTQSDSNPQSSISRASQADLSDPILSSSSTFCASLYSSLSTNSKSCRQTSALPFLPHPPKCEQHQFSAGESSSSSLLFGADLTNGGHYDAEHSGDLKDFLNLSGDAPDGSFRGKSNAMTFSEQMEFQLV